MKIYLVVTIDVEPDCSSTWHYSNPLTFDGVSYGIKERLQPLFNKYNICPTYLINNVVLEDEKSVEIFLDLKGDFELGTHLHPEFIEPQKIFNDYAGMKGEANQCSLPPDIEFEKMKNITELFEKQFNKRPTSFRAGRFSAGVNTINSLEKLNYKIDTSVTPHINWNDKTREYPVNYISAPEQPFFIKRDTFFMKNGKGKILEVPVSIANTTKFFLKRPTWLRPIYSNYRGFIKVIDTYLKNYSKNEMIVFNLMFHNVEIIPNKNPYTRTKNDCTKYFNLLEKFFSYCNNHEIKSINLSGLYPLWQ